MSETSEHTATANRALADVLPFGDTADFDDARRGFLARLDPGLVADTGGRVVWDIDAYGFLDAACPDSVNPSLWRQAQLVTMHGLFEVVPGIYQVRGLDLSNLTIIEGERGVIVIDPLISAETAAAALALYRRERGDRPVTGVIYTHCHVDHFGGVKGVVSAEEVAAGVPVIAPVHFVEHAVSENLYAGPAMARRASYMYGAMLEPGPAGQVTAGLGPTTSLGSVTLISPTVEITHTGQELVVDGVRMVFQLTPGTEAPAEMNFFFPDHRALCAAENATHNLHNLVTLRGAVVRDAHHWATYLDEAIELFGADADVVFASHHWPRWGNDRVIDFLAKQRDVYGYLHDQTLRLLNQGLIGVEIAEQLELPPSLASEWHCRGYYGSVSHNVKAIYQRYLGWFDGNPAHLWPHPPVEAAERYVAFMGGADAVVDKATVAFDQGDFRWVAEVVNHVIFAQPDHAGARQLQARAFDQLGYGAENATWRNFYLTGAKELRHGIVPETPGATSADLMGAITIEQIFDSLAVRLDGPRAWGLTLHVNWTFTDRDETYLLTLDNAVLTHRSGRHHPHPDAAVTAELSALVGLLAGTADASALHIEGDPTVLGTLLGLLEEPNPAFPLVTPRSHP